MGLLCLSEALVPASHPGATLNAQACRRRVHDRALRELAEPSSCAATYEVSRPLGFRLIRKCKLFGLREIRPRRVMLIENQHG